MPAEIRIEEVTKVVSKTMHIGQRGVFMSQYFYNTVEHQSRLVYINDESCDMSGYAPKIKKDLLGWGC